MPDDPVFQTALKRAMALCATREQCTSDIRYKLTEWGVGKTGAEKIITVLTEEKFISETRYATAFTRDKFNHGRWGKIKIASHLRIKNIPEEIIGAALSDIDESDYREAVREVMSAHRRIIRAKNKFDLKGKLLRFGLSRGYESHLLYDLLNDIE